MKTPTSSEILKLQAALKEFTGVMDSVLTKAAIQGARGWDDPQCTQHFRGMLIYSAKRAELEGEEQTPDYIAIANYAMFLWHLDKKGK